MPGHVDIADESSTRLVVRLLQRQRLVEHEPARAREAAHLALLLPIRTQLELERLESLHGWLNIQPIGHHFKRRWMPVASALSLLHVNGEVCRANDQHQRQ